MMGRLWVRRAGVYFERSIRVVLRRGIAALLAFEKLFQVGLFTSYVGKDCCSVISYVLQELVVIYYIG